MSRRLNTLSLTFQGLAHRLAPASALEGLFTPVPGSTTARATTDTTENDQ